MPDPDAAIRELRRIVRPGGRVLLTTHGVHHYHPSPLDLWRWTHTGLETIFENNGPWESVTVTAGAGTAATLASLIAHQVDLLFKRAGVNFLARPFVAALNAAGGALDAGRSSARACSGLVERANFHVSRQLAANRGSAPLVCRLTAPFRRDVGYVWRRAGVGRAVR